MSEARSHLFSSLPDCIIAKSPWAFFNLNIFAFVDLECHNEDYGLLSGKRVWLR